VEYRDVSFLRLSTTQGMTCPQRYFGQSYDVGIRFVLGVVEISQGVQKLKGTHTRAQYVDLTSLL
jgi:hypothetical protein